MSMLWIGLLAAAAVLAVVLHQRRTLRARQRCRRQLDAFLERSGAARGTVETLARVDLGRLERLLRGRDPAAHDRLLRALADTAALQPRALRGGYELKRQGRRTLPRLAGEVLALAAPAPPPVRYRPPESGLPTAYLVDGDPRRYLSEEHLDGAGIDARDLHGVALAVLRQQFDVDEPRRALTAGAVARIEPDDGCGGSRLLLLPETLAAGESLFAAAPTPAVLLVAGERHHLDQALAECADLPEPLPPAVFRVTADGLRRES